MRGKQKARHPRQETAAQHIAPEMGATGNHSTPCRWKAIALYAGLFGFVLACFALEGWWRTCA